MCVEGQQIATDILDDRPRAWDRFLESYGERLLARAGKLLASCHALRQTLQAIDLVQDFLTVKVLHRPQVMFRPVAKGQQPLWPRLCCSLVNHGNTLLRRINRRIHEVAIDEPSQLRQVAPRTGLCDRSVIAERLAGCLNAIREALPIPAVSGQVAYRHLLLLKVRMDLLPRLNHAYQLEDGELPVGVSLVRMAEELVPWTAGEAAQTLLPDSTLTLDQVWAQFAVIAPARGYKLESPEAASVLGIPPNTWNVYQMRARKKTIAHHGHDIFDELFPCGETARRDLQ